MSVETVNIVFTVVTFLPNFIATQTQTSERTHGGAEINEKIRQKMDGFFILVVKNDFLQTLSQSRLPFLKSRSRF